jgi:predicted metal-dependent phosphoesterase TrpH
LKIDLHMHAKERSGCGRNTEEEMIAAAKAAGLDAIAFTDHDRLVGHEHLAELNRLHAPFRIFGGIEITISQYDHCIVLGLQSPELEGGRWAYENLHLFVRDHGGFLAIAHPFRFGEGFPFDLEALPPDAIEIHSIHTSAEHEERIREIATAVGAGLLCNSDAHAAEHVGLFWNEVEGEAETDEELVRLLVTATRACGGAEARPGEPKGPVAVRSAEF